MKDPAILFYTSDFLTGVTDLTMEERGQYITLLCLQHQKGRLTEKMIGIAVGHAAADVLGKFKKDDQGRYYNPRLEKEAFKRAEHSEKQRKRAKEGWKKRKSQKECEATADATALPLESENVNVSDIEIKKDKGGVGEKGKLELTLEMAEYFKVSELRNARRYFQLSKLVRSQDTDELRRQFEGYRSYKDLSGEKVHGIEGYLGKEEDNSDGAWCACDWVAKAKELQNSSPKKGFDARLERMEKSVQSSSDYIKQQRKMRADEK